MTGTWLELFRNSLFRSGVLGRGQIESASLLNEAQQTAKLLLDELDGEGLSLPVVSTEINFNTVPNQAKYGLGGPFDAGTSDESVTIALGLVTWPTVAGGFPFVEGQIVTALQAADDPSVYMKGKVVSFNGTALVVNVTEIAGSGGYTTWFFTVSMFRPETILGGRLQTAGGANPTYNRIFSMDYTEYKLNISTPQNPGMPSNYSLNQGWPIADLYFYPSPSQIWLITLVCKLRWADTVSDPMNSVNSVAEVPSGYTNAFTDILALRLAENNRLETPTLQSKAYKGKYLMAAYTWGQMDGSSGGMGDPFPSNTLVAGSNPWGSR